jgi:GNAT superfamily N-acetyltransferase
MPRFGDPEPLADHHLLEGFDCGTESLNRWLVEHEAQAAGGGSARTYVVVDADQERVVGYHALAAAAITPADATLRARRGQPRHPIPAVLLARLAVDASVQRRGLGALLLRDAMMRALAASEQIGARVLLVHALHEPIRGFYERWGFEPSPTDLLNLQLLFTDIRRTLASAPPARHDRR